LENRTSLGFVKLHGLLLGKITDEIIF
jgi:hypothetical protein